MQACVNLVLNRNFFIVYHFCMRTLNLDLGLLNDFLIVRIFSAIEGEVAEGSLLANFKFCGVMSDRRAVLDELKPKA